MSWVHYVEGFCAGMFLANTVPHFVKGICGDRFPTPFAHPPGKGLSSPLVNIVWSLGNMALGYWLYCAAAIASGGIAAHSVFFAGVAALSIPMSIHFARKQSG